MAPFTGTSAKTHQLLQSAFNGNLRLLKAVAVELDDGKGTTETIDGIRDSMGMSAIHLAASQGKLDVCKYLIGDLKLDLDVQETHRGKTPLHCAIKESHLSIAFYLLEKGAKFDIPDDRGDTSLHYAAEKGHKKLLHLMLSRGANVDTLSTQGTPLQMAAQFGKHEVVEVLLQYRANPNLTYRPICSPLMASIAANSLQCMQLLLEAGADPNACGLGSRPLEYAVFLGQTDMVLSMVKAGADPNMTNEDGLTPIEVAAVEGNTQVVEILLPKTKPISIYSEWSLGGIMKHLHSQEARVQRRLRQKEKFRVEKLKGDNAFREKDYTVASFYYSTALAYEPSNAILYSNRSLCWLRLKMYQVAFKDAMQCIMLKPDWPKAYYRAGAAMSANGDFEEATKAFIDGLKLDPGNQELKNAYQEAVEGKIMSNHIYS